MSTCELHITLNYEITLIHPPLSANNLVFKQGYRLPQIEGGLPQIIT